MTTPTVKTLKKWPITNSRHLCAVLKVSDTKLQEIEENVTSYYYTFIKKEVKKDGIIKSREVTPSDGDLKVIQKRIESNILRNIPLPSYIYGGRKGMSNISNARAHLGKKHKFCLDIKNFFPSVSIARVSKCLNSFGFHPEISNRLTRLITYKGHVPQGAPTSTAITNLVFYLEVDKKIESIIKGHNIVYTRFVDDLNFSSQSDFSDVAVEIVKAVIGAGYKISKNKTFYKLGKVEMTGAKVGNNSMSATQKHKDKLADISLEETSRLALENYIKRLKQ